MIIGGEVLYAPLKEYMIIIGVYRLGKGVWRDKGICPVVFSLKEHQCHLTLMLGYDRFSSGYSNGLFTFSTVVAL